MSIEEHSFSDGDVRGAVIESKEITIIISDGAIGLDKKDVIAMAKALNVTWEDLKGD